MSDALRKRVLTAVVLAAAHGDTRRGANMIQASASNHHSTATASTRSRRAGLVEKLHTSHSSTPTRST